MVNMVFLLLFIASFLLLVAVFWVGHEATHGYQIWRSDNVRYCGFDMGLTSGWIQCEEPGFNNEEYIEESKNWERDADRIGRTGVVLAVALLLVKIKLR